MNFFDLRGVVVAVIGGTGVLGGAIAKGLAGHGATVGILGRNQSRGMDVCTNIGEAGGTAGFVGCNALNVDSLECAQHSLQKQFGNVDVLINAAGGNRPNATVADGLRVEDIALDDWLDAFDLNMVGGALLPCQVFGRLMVERGAGSIVNIASIAGHIPLSRVVAYSAAKAAVVNFTQFLAREWASNGVRVNSITPGFFPAEQNRSLLFGEDGTPTPRAQQILDHTPLNRFGEANELVGAAVFLSSSSASGFVTGTDLRVDGGFLSNTI
jgi:NAD(P)-dependent dehydrogenase (short-subunit alcohol dehydrogenase family)